MPPAVRYSARAGLRQRRFERRQAAIHLGDQGARPCPLAEGLADGEHTLPRRRQAGVVSDLGDRNVETAQHFGGTEAAAPLAHDEIGGKHQRRLGSGPGPWHTLGARRHVRIFGSRLGETATICSRSANAKTYWSAQ
jgi:hypothetical protein